MFDKRFKRIIYVTMCMYNVFTVPLCYSVGSTWFVKNYFVLIRLHDLKH